MKYKICERSGLKLVYVFLRSLNYKTHCFLSTLVKDYKSILVGPERISKSCH
jgi:hypothetical protein